MLCRLTPHLAVPEVAHRGVDVGLEPLGVQVTANELVLEQVKCCSDRFCLLPSADSPTHFLLFLSKCSNRCHVLCTWDVVVDFYPN